MQAPGSSNGSTSYLMPYDGIGYGQSQYWVYSTRQIAMKNLEFCTCWDDNSPSITISPNYNQLKADPKSHAVKIRISCAHKQPDCSPSFSKTEFDLEEKFRDFYKG